MTSLAFILGVMPLVFASGAGQEARHSVGTAVAGGMLASTFLNLPSFRCCMSSSRASADGGGDASADSWGRAACAAARSTAALGLSAPGGSSMLAARRRARSRRSRPSASRSTRPSRARSSGIPSAAIAAAGILRAEALLDAGAGGDAAAGERQRHDHDAESRRRVRGRDGDAAEPADGGARRPDAAVRAGARGRGARRPTTARTSPSSAPTDVRRQTALPTADAYLAIIARRRVVEANVRARDTAQAHFDLAQRARSSRAPAAG